MVKPRRADTDVDCIACPCCTPAALSCCYPALLTKHLILHHSSEPSKGMDHGSSYRCAVQQCRHKRSKDLGPPCRFPPGGQTEHDAKNSGHGCSLRSPGGYEKDHPGD